MLSQSEQIESIKALKARYFRFLDTKRWDDWRGVFASDAILDTDHSVPNADRSVVKMPTLRGADAIVSAVSAALANARTVHHGHMPEIELMSDTSARGIWSMEDIVEQPGGTLHGFGHYHETYIRIDERWYIQTLHLTRLRMEFSGTFESAMVAQ